MEYVGYRTKGQYGTLVIVAAFSSFLSILGSIAVTRIAYLKMTSTYQRFLFMLSLVDILSSAFLVIHQLLLPEAPDFYWAVGSTKTCSLVGFFLNFGTLSVAMYSCYLSVYFYFSIQSSPKRQKQPEDIIGVWEWCAHLSCLGLPGGIAVAAAATNNLDVSEPLGLCVIQSYDCMDEASDYQGECVPAGGDGWLLPKGTNSLRWAWIASMIIATCAGITATIMVYCRVQGVLTKGGDNGGGADAAALAEEMKQRLRAVATQAILYTGVFVNTLLWPLLAVVVPSKGDAPPFTLLFLAFLIYPLQGVLNCFIYIRPRFQMLRAMYPDDSVMVVFRVSMSKAGDPDEIEEVRERIYGDNYEMPSIQSSVHSLASDMPNEVAFDPNKSMSNNSVVSVTNDDDDLDPEANQPKDAAVPQKKEGDEEAVGSDAKSG